MFLFFGTVQEVLLPCKQTWFTFTMTDSADLDGALFQHLVGCHPYDLYNKLFQNMAGTMNDAVEALESNLLEEYKEESDKCDEIKKHCYAMRQVRGVHDIVYNNNNLFFGYRNSYTRELNIL